MRIAFLCRWNRSAGRLGSNCCKLWKNTHPETGRIDLAEQNERQLDSVLDALVTAGALDSGVGAYHHAKIGTDGALSAPVALSVAPLHEEGGFRFGYEGEARALPSKLLHHISAGVERALDDGLSAGFPVIGVAVTLERFEGPEAGAGLLAAGAERMAMRDAVQAAGSVVLELVLRVEVTCSAAASVGIAGLLAKRRGTILEIGDSGRAVCKVTRVPVMSFLGWSNDVQQITEDPVEAGTALAVYQELPRSSPEGPDMFPPAIGIWA